MSTPSSTPIYMSDVTAEFGGDGYLKSYLGCADGVPTTTPIYLTDLLGKSDTPSTPSVGPLSFDKASLTAPWGYRDRIYLATNGRIYVQADDGSAWAYPGSSGYTTFIDPGTADYTTWEFKLSHTINGKQAGVWYPAASAVLVETQWNQDLDGVTFTMREIAHPTNEDSFTIIS